MLLSKRYNNTVYMVHLADIKFGKLECNANWRAFSLANRINKRSRLTIISVDGHKIWQLKLNLPNHHIKITAKCTVYTVLYACKG